MVTSLTDKSRNMLVIRRCVYGIQTCEQWRIQYNHEFYALYKEPKLSDYIKLKHLQWAGHVLQILEDRVLPENNHMENTVAMDDNDIC